MENTNEALLRQLPSPSSMKRLGLFLSCGLIELKRKTL